MKIISYISKKKKKNPPIWINKIIHDGGFFQNEIKIEKEKTKIIIDNNNYK